MTTLLPSAERRSRWLLDWSAAACLSAVDQSLSAQTGQAATFTRAGVKTAFDENGVVRVVPYGLPAFQWSLDPVSGLMVPGVLLEGARTNVVLWNRDLTNAAWTKTNITAAKTITGTDGVANSATSLTATAANGTVMQAITLGSSARFQSAYVKRITGSGVINMTMDNGATWTAIAVTSVWTRVKIPGQTLANPTVGFQIVTSADAIAVDFVQNEDAIFGALASSPIATTTTAVTRVVDDFSLAFTALPFAMTIYERHVDLGSQAAAGPGLYEVGAWGTPPALTFYVSSAFLSVTHNGGGGQVSSNTVPTSIVSGDVVETRMLLSSTGTVQPNFARNGGAETVGAPSAASALGAAWSPQRIRLNLYTSSVTGFASFQSVRIAAGVQSMATMRQG